MKWQELLCCLKYMDEKEVNAAQLAPETRDMMIGYAETVMARGSPVNTLEGVSNAMMGKWKMAFTTEDRYKVLPPATRVFLHIHRDGKLENIVKVGRVEIGPSVMSSIYLLTWSIIIHHLQFKDAYWDRLISTARYQLTPQGRIVFEFTSNQVMFNSPFSKGSQVRNK